MPENTVPFVNYNGQIMANQINIWKKKKKHWKKIFIKIYRINFYK